MMTEQRACRTHCSATDPSASCANAHRPRCSTISMSASRDALISTLAGGPATTVRSTFGAAGVLGQSFVDQRLGLLLTLWAISCSVTDIGMPPGSAP